MTREIKKVAVLGAGVMGSGIAAHLAGAGIPSLLLDIVPKLTDDDKKAGLTEKDPKFRNKFALAGLDNIASSKPSVIYTKRDLKLITPGNYEDDFNKIKECDWVVEVVVERIDIKKIVFDKVEKAMKPGTIISSNTSGIPLAKLVEGRSKEFKKNFLITHFFNPVRYMKLLEIVTGPDTDPEVTKMVAKFMEDVLGKGVVYAKDTPNFIANRIGVYGMMATLQMAVNDGYKVEEVDKILGPATGRPKSAIFRTGDLVGLDTLVHVSNNTYEACPNDEKRNVFAIPEVLKKMVDNKWLGDKTKQGFYRKSKTPEGKKEILSLDFKTMDYKPSEKVQFESLGAAKNIDEPDQRIKKVVWSDDRGGQFAWKAILDTIVYATNRVPEIADDIVNVDNAMKWGFNWELGPFETWDAIGVKEAAERLKKEGIQVPKLIEDVLTKGEGKFYKAQNGTRYFFDIGTKTYKPVEKKPGTITLKQCRAGNKVVKQGASASLVDIGDGVACLEFHSKMNAIDDDIISLARWSVEEVGKNWNGMVIHNEGTNFSVGANLMLIFMAAQQKDWKGLEKVIRDFQAMTMGFRYSPKPVVAAPFAMTLGGGCEVSMGCDAIRAHAELYMGLVEVGVGLIPAGGGCKEMVLRGGTIVKKQLDKTNKGIDWSQTWWPKGLSAGPFQRSQHAFQTIAFAKVSTSAKEAYDYGYLNPNDKISISRDNVLADAKQDVLAMAKNYVEPKPREDIWVPGEGGWYAFKSAITAFAAQGVITEHDSVIADHLAYILTCGNRKSPSIVKEQDILDLECEVFLKLCGMEKTNARMQHMLMKGKPLRN